MYPISSSSMIIREKVMVDYINKYNYLVIFPDKKTELFKSLRDIQNSISIDSSTISKKLKNNEHIFVAKGSNYIFYIQTLK
jgi:hypothetical protein